MAEDCDPAILHARICVLESDSKRHEEDITVLYGKVSALEICASSLPKIEKSLEKIQAKVDSLTSCSVKKDGQEEGKRAAFLTVREWILLAIALLGFLGEYIILR